MVRTPYIDENGVKKGAWSPEEDHKLRAYILRYGHWNWRELPKFAGLARCGKSCRLRWMNYLRPNIKRGSYTKEEEHLIIKLHEKLGNKWSSIAEKLPGRTDNEIKNYWHTNLKKNVQHQQQTMSNTNTKTKAKTKKWGQNWKSNQKFHSHDELQNNNENNCRKNGPLPLQILESCPLYPYSPSSNFSSGTFSTIDNLDNSYSNSNSNSNSDSNSDSCTGSSSSLGLGLGSGTTSPRETWGEIADGIGSFWNEPFAVGSYEEEKRDDNDFGFLDAMSLSPYTSCFENMDLSFLLSQDGQEELQLEVDGYKCKYATLGTFQQ